MSPTETDLRGTYRDRAPDGVVTSMEARLRDVLLDDDNRTGIDVRRRLGPGARVGTVLGAVAAVAAVVALAIGLGATGSPDAQHGTPSGGSPAPVRLSFVAHLDLPTGYRTTFRSVTADREMIGLRLTGSPDATCACSDAASTTLVAVYRRGFDPAVLRHRNPTTVDGRTAYLGTMLPGPLDAMTDTGYGRFATLAFQYRAGYWATVVGRSPQAARAQRLRAVASALRVGSPTAIRLPFRLGAPHGLRVLSFTRTAPAGSEPPFSTVVLSTGVTYGGSDGGRALLIRVYPEGAVSPDIITGSMTRPIAGGTRTGHTNTDVAAERTPEAYFRLGHRALIDFSGQGLRGHAFVDLVHHLVWANHVTPDERTWLPASRLTRGR